MKPHLEEATRMLNMADRDMAAYRVLRDSNEVHFSVICFHAQQAVEKCLKAVLYFRRIEFRRTHDLTLLCELLAEHRIPLPFPIEEITRLTPCAVTLRYDDVEIEVANLDVADLERIVTVTRQWADDILRRAANND
jgi:HEPN domain-containing protein